MMIRDVQVTYSSRRMPEVPNPGRVDCAERLVVVLDAWGINDLPQERFVAVHLDAQHRVVGIQEVARGSLGAVEVHPREVFRGAVLQGSAAVILAHNHPSGVSDQSTADVVITKRLCEAGQLLGIPVLDHVILADGSHNSALANGWMP